MKRIAIILSGHMRSYQYCYASFREFIVEPLNADVYLWTWSMMGSNNAIDEYMVNMQTLPWKSNIISCYRPIHFHVEKSKYVNGTIYNKYLVDKRSTNNVLTMFWSMSESYSLMYDWICKNNKQYDIIMRCRPDIKFEAPIDKNAIDDSINNLYVPEVGHYGGVNDQLAFGPPKLMSIYNSVYYSIPKLVKQVEFKPEPLLKQHLINYNLQNQIKTTPIMYYLKRMKNGCDLDHRTFSPEPLKF